MFDFVGLYKGKEISKSFTNILIHKFSLEVTKTNNTSAAGMEQQSQFSDLVSACDNDVFSSITLNIKSYLTVRHVSCFPPFFNIYNCN